MTKKEAIAYAQVTLDFMQSKQYLGDITPDTFAIKMKQAFKAYPKSIILAIADSQKYARRKLQEYKNGCDDDE